MKLTLMIAGEAKEFKAPFISGRMLRKTMEFQKKVATTDIAPELLDQLADYVVELYGKQFTQDEFYDGIEAQKMLTTIMSSLNEVVNGANESTEGLKDPNDQ